MSENLPPGCTLTDIEIASGAIVYCDQCGRLFKPDEDETECPNCRYADDLPGGADCVE